MRVFLTWSIFFAACPPDTSPGRAYQLAEVAVLRDEQAPLAQRALHHLFHGYPLKVSAIGLFLSVVGAGLQVVGLMR
jgi:hypothetical protein